FFRNARIPQSVPKSNAAADMVRKETVAPVRLQRLVLELKTLSAGGIQRRTGCAEAGGRRDGKGARRGKNRYGAHYRPANQTRVSSAGARRSGAPPGRHRPHRS